ncbi:hypothetical protein Tsubulata_010747 [Turnera subulata]|uniref:RRM domain-containing protein n=1 Tax=Turnera subulata TaxID=218843 RepID=A0A9Q0J955_9ROSI|nr:hypothetical protein Tsubulata_010747 [Turnera subulata]
MSPGLPGGYPPIHYPKNAQNTLAPSSLSLQPSFSPPNTQLTNYPPNENYQNTHSAIPEFLNQPHHLAAHDSPTSRQFSRWNRRTIQNAINNNQVLSLYVANVPRRWLPTDIHLGMSKYGEVLEVFIPRKLNNKGKRFAFVRFKNNVQPQFLIKHISSMQVDGERLIASVARARATNTKNGNEESKNKQAARTKPAPAGLRDNRSFAEVVRADDNLKVPDAYGNTTLVGLPCSSFIPKDASLN